MRNHLLPFCLLLVGCMPGAIPDQATRAAQPAPMSALPPIKTFSTPTPARPQRSNDDIVARARVVHNIVEPEEEAPTLAEVREMIDEAERAADEDVEDDVVQSK